MKSAGTAAPISPAPDVVALLPPPLSGTLFKQPNGLALDGQETRLYVADTGNNRIVAIPIKRGHVDTIAPRALIAAPPSGSTVFGTVSVAGVAADAYFGEYRLEVGAGESPALFTTVAVSATPVWDGTLAAWNTSSLPPGVYALRLTVSDRSGSTTEARTTVIVTAPALVWRRPGYEGREGAADPVSPATERGEKGP